MNEEIEKLLKEIKQAIARAVEFEINENVQTGLIKAIDIINLQTRTLEEKKLD